MCTGGGIQFYCLSAFYFAQLLISSVCNFQGYSSLRFRPIRHLSSPVEDLEMCKVVGVTDKASQTLTTHLFQYQCCVLTLLVVLILLGSGLSFFLFF